MFSKSSSWISRFQRDQIKKISKYKHIKANHKLQLDWKPIVGLEVHAQLKTNSKLFSGSSAKFGSPVNSNVSIFDAAIPGTLPVLNRKCVELGVLTALALSCQVNEISLFDRKHYFYADLPAGYQITQQRAPLARNGILKFPVFNPAKHRTLYHGSSKVLQVQLEQDSGKSLHDEDSQRSLIDLNRAGIPLLEIVFAPDLSDGEEASALVKELILILSRIGVCSCKMEEGALRVDANISVHKAEQKLGVRTEVKNIGSLRGVAHAIEFEIERQIEALSSGGEVVNETRSWDALSGKTVPMRDKEVKQDYRFMPEPNLPPLVLNLSNKHKDDFVNVDGLKANIPELPEASRETIKTKYSLAMDLILNIVSEEKLLSLFYKIMKVESRDPKIVAVLLSNELLSLVNKNLASLEDENFNEINIGEIADLQQSKEINLVTARKIMEEIALGSPYSPNKLIELLGLKQITDVDELTAMCDKAIDENPKLVSLYKSGKKKVFSALLGIIAKTYNNKANMEEVTKILKKKLDEQ